MRSASIRGSLKSAKCEPYTRGTEEKQHLEALLGGTAAPSVSPPSRKKHRKQPRSDGEFPKNSMASFTVPMP